MSEREKGTVKWFNGEKGYGFIAPEDGSDDIFVHYTSIIADGYRTLKENQKVEFMIVEGKNGKGTQAQDVKIIG
jgi:CspA family cold shock protein